VESFVGRTLQRHLLAVHAATGAEALWRAVRGLLRAAVPAHRVTLFLGHLGPSPARLVFTDPPIPDAEAWYRARARNNPFSRHIDAHPGVRWYRFRDVLAHGWQRTEFGRRFAVAEGWDKGVSFLYWRRGAVSGMYSLYRGSREVEFTAFELAVLRRLQPHIGVAIERVRLLQDERLSRRGLEEFNRRLPLGLLLLDWDVDLVFANDEGYALSAAWNFGEVPARAMKGRACFQVPGPVRQALESWRRELGADPAAAAAQPSRRVVHPAGGLQAEMTVLAGDDDRLARPRFLVVLERLGRVREPHEPSPIPERVARLRGLSVREREVVEMVCEGLSNVEIAERRGRSVLTVKTQLHAIFTKLGVRSRARLIALVGEGQ
jgi:DNA-binding CsgD family transcriptional regulator